MSILITLAYVLGFKWNVHRVGHDELVGGSSIHSFSCISARTLVDEQRSFVSNPIKLRFKSTKRSVVTRESSILIADFLCLGQTSGMSIGDPVLRTGKPLSVELGPGQ